MNIEELNAYIENKEVLDQKAISQIMVLIEKNPYFQIAHMLLLKAMHQSQPEKYNGQLKISASFISDKKKLYQYIHDQIAQKTLTAATKKDEKTEKAIETKNTDKIKENSSIVKEAADIISRKEELVTNQIVEKKSILTEGNQTSNEKLEVKILVGEKTEITEGIIKKPEVKKKVDLAEDEIEKIANQNSEIKHKKIVSDFFHTTVKEKTEINSIQNETEPVIKEKSPELTEKKEFPGKQQIKSILEEKKRNIISKNEPSIIEKKVPIIQEIEKVENKTITKEEPSEIQKEVIIKKQAAFIEKTIEIPQEQNKPEPIQNKDIEKVEEKAISIPELKVDEKTSKIELVKETENKTKEKTLENKEITEGMDAMSTIFSKIKQIKKEMNLETGKTPLPIDINTNNQTIKNQEKKGPAKQIKESFIGFEESEIKTDELIGDQPIKIEKTEESSTGTNINQEIKTSGITAKDLFKNHLKTKEKENEINVSLNSKNEETKSPISKVIEKINQSETEPDQKIEKLESSLIIEPKQPENLTPTVEKKESAADELLRRIAEKKKRLHEEKEREEIEKLKNKENSLQASELKTEEKIETSQTLNEIIHENNNNDQVKSEDAKNKLDFEKSSLPKEKKSQFLIDSFIERIDSLERIGTRETTLVGDISEKSTEEKDEFMTETMADLYIQQKNYQKAIEIYNKLILKFPEKKTYFAIQIKKTENLNK